MKAAILYMFIRSSPARIAFARSSSGVRGRPDEEMLMTAPATSGFPNSSRAIPSIVWGKAGGYAPARGTSTPNARRMANPRTQARTPDAVVDE